jgi:hypothetical protein
MARLIGGEQQRRVEASVARASSAWVERNAVVHGLWVAFANDPPDRMGTMHFRRPGQVSGRSWTLEELETLAAEIEATTRELFDIEFEIDIDRS